MNLLAGITPSDLERLERVNADHHVRIDEDERVNYTSTQLSELRRKHQHSREKITEAMLGCVERWSMQASGAARVLELGVGEGYDIGYLEERFARGRELALYTGIDVDRQRLEKWTAYQFRHDAHVERHFVHAAVEKLPEDWTGLFDFVYSRHVMEHVISVDAALSEVRRVLAPHGVVGAVTPHLFPDPEPAHVTQQTLREWMQHYRRHGLISAYAVELHFNGPEAHLVCVRDDWPNGPR